ncbi:hypothetical protein BDZ89DRAFT_1062253 [Hymenopellis radicata]|nr:hypothetical protein BDZ89DRAFT_1062253 [Hymenopellis radicata]
MTYASASCLCSITVMVALLPLPAPCHEQVLSPYAMDEATPLDDTQATRPIHRTRTTQWMATQDTTTFGLDNTHWTRPIRWTRTKRPLPWTIPVTRGPPAGR